MARNSSVNISVANNTTVHVNESVVSFTISPEHIATTTTFPYPKLRTAVPYILILLCISILIANAVVLAAFIKNRHLRTPFNMYIISLVIADLTQTLLDLPFTVMSQSFRVAAGSSCM
ncbi:hypothetical protein BV898_08041 [Hypsibius exemplaris]|uniref:G-protein coupled receptors family 1 profile domain-containing protein n=1 Tax=Hypsibius exemplaris TaxID=2072580 RepID=A0A1W0WRU8_HYPEX|nr:hypothetical protein BV898_08041 [Hypsibius exemplaris]